MFSILRSHAGGDASPPPAPKKKGPKGKSQVDIIPESEKKGHKGKPQPEVTPETDKKGQKGKPQPEVIPEPEKVVKSPSDISREYVYLLFLFFYL